MVNGAADLEHQPSGGALHAQPGATLIELVQRQTETATTNSHHLQEMRRELAEQRAQLGTQSTHLGRLVELKEQERAEAAAAAALRITEAQADGAHRRQMHATIIERALYVIGGLAAAGGAYWFGTSATP
jgi:hypothetical protein